jgi:kinesin family protein 6/9
MVQQYKQSYQTLKELKLEIEHLQHLLEQGRVRMTRDFEAWYVQVYQETEQPYDTESEPVSRQDSLRLVFKPQSPPQTIGSLLTKADSPQTIGSLLTKADSDYTARPRSQTPLTTSPRVLSRQSESLSNSTPSIATTLYSPKPTPIDVKSFDRVSSRQSNHSEGRPTSSQSRNVRQDVQAFYQARQEIMNRTRPSLQ